MSSSLHHIAECFVMCTVLYTNALYVFFISVLFLLCILYVYNILCMYNVLYVLVCNVLYTCNVCTLYVLYCICTVYMCTSGLAVQRTLAAGV